MEFWLVVGLILGVVLAWAAISDRRDRRYHHLRSHSEMADYHREHLGDVRAADMGFHLNPIGPGCTVPVPPSSRADPAMDSTGDDVGRYRLDNAPDLSSKEGILRDGVDGWGSTSDP
jgi:hypothetical protein